MEEKEK